jgi:hypothetical protein
MNENTTDELVRLAVRINKGLARSLKVAAAMREITIQDLVAQAIEKEIAPEKVLRLSGILEDVEQGTEASGERYATAYLVHNGGRQYLQADGAKMADKLKEGDQVTITGKRDTNPVVFVQTIKEEMPAHDVAAFDELDAIAAQARKEVRRG